MTIERRLIAGIDDIKGVCFECLGCHARNTVLPDDIRAIPSECPRCHKAWTPFRPVQEVPTAVSPYVNLAESIERIRVLMKEGVAQGFRLLLEFEEPGR